MLSKFYGKAYYFKNLVVVSQYNIQWIQFPK